MLSAIVAFGCVTPVPAHSLTMSEALNLPLGKITSEVLGEVGILYPEATRPTGYEYAILGVAPGMKRILTAMNFYGRAEITSSSGLCEASELTVGFNKEGRPYSLEYKNNFGISGAGISSALPEHGATPPSEALKKSCSEVESTKGFFSAPSVVVADHAARSLQAAIEAHATGKMIAAQYHCDQPCKSNDSPFEYLRLSDIKDVEPADCQTEKPIFRQNSEKDNICVDITMWSAFGSDVTIFIESHERAGRITVERLDVKRSRYVV